MKTVAEADADNKITRYYIYGAGLLAMVTPADKVYCYHYNAIGSTIAISDKEQNLVNKYAYAPFGEILNQEEEIPQPFKFVGQHGVMSESNGYYYMRARYYDPETGRFISEDPTGFEGGDVNLYAYASNNPMLVIDPLGLCGGETSWWEKLGEGVQEAWQGHVEWHGELRRSVSESGPYGQGGPFVAFAGMEIVGLGGTLYTAGFTAMAEGGTAAIISGGGWVVVGVETIWIGIDIMGGYVDSLQKKR